MDSYEFLRAAQYLRVHATSIRESNINSDGDWAHGNGRYSTPKSAILDLLDQYDEMMSLAKALAIAAQNEEGSREVTRIVDELARRGTVAADADAA